MDESKWTRGGHGEAFIWSGAKGRLADDHADVDGQGNFVVKVSRDADGTFDATPFNFGGLEFTPVAKESP